MRLLLVEDDLLLGDGICVGLMREGYTVYETFIPQADRLYEQHLDEIRKENKP